MKLPAWVNRLKTKLSKQAQADPQSTARDKRLVYVEEPIGELEKDVSKYYPEYEQGLPEADVSVLPFDPSQHGEKMKEWRRDFRFTDYMLKALAAHISQLEEMREANDDFIEMVSLAIDSTANVPVQRRETASKIMAILRKIRSDLESTGILIARYNNVVYATRDSVLYAVDPKGIATETMPGYEHVMTRPQLFEVWKYQALEKMQRAEALGKDPPKYAISAFHAKDAFRKAWAKYLEEHAKIIEPRTLFRYGAMVRGVPVAEGETTEADAVVRGLFLVARHVETYKEMVEVMGEFYNDLEELALGAYIPEGQQVAAMKRKASVGGLALINILPEEDGDGKVFNAYGKVIRTDDEHVVVVDENGRTYSAPNSRVISAQAGGGIGTPFTKRRRRPSEETIDFQLTGPVVKTNEPREPQVVDEATAPAPPESPTTDETKLKPLPLPPEYESISKDIPESVWEYLDISGRIRFAAVNRRLIELTYTKQGDPPYDPEVGVQKTYIVEPYSLRVKRPIHLGGMSRWYLAAYDTQDGHIKLFIRSNINSVKVMEETFDPKWEVEFWSSESFEKQVDRYNRRLEEGA